MTEFLLENPLLLLFAVVAIGYPLGRIQVRGSSLGVASVLFAGLAIGAIDEDLRLPPIVYQLGLVLFVYTIGLSNGRAFFSSMKRRGARDGLLVVGVVSLGAVLTAGMYALLDLKPALAAGMFAGSMTNTPALAAQLEYLQEYGNQSSLQQLLAEPVVGYSVSYPIGVLGVIVAIAIASDSGRSTTGPRHADPKPPRSRRRHCRAAPCGSPVLNTPARRSGAWCKSRAGQ